jgi:hypothetical protein
LCNLLHTHVGVLLVGSHTSVMGHKFHGFPTDLRVQNALLISFIGIII